MNILFILPYVPFPLSSGGNQAVFNMIDKAREQHHISLLLDITHKEAAKNLEHLRTIWNDITFYPYHEKFEEEEDKTLKYKVYKKLPKTFTRKLALSFFLLTVYKKLQKTFTRKVYREFFKHQKYDFVRKNSCLNHPYPSFSEGYKHFVYQVSRKGFDAIQVEFFESLPLVYLLPENVCKIYIQHEIRYIRNKNELHLFKQQTPTDFYTWSILKNMEISALRRYNYIVALTEIDKKKMLETENRLNIFVSPAAIKLSNKKLSYTQPAKELVFVGSGDHFPNLDGMMWFCQEILPLLKKDINNIKVNIVGKWNKHQQKELKDIDIEDSLNFTGYVEDLETYMNGKISIVPIRIGSGMRMKLLDSLNSASPIVTTSKGCEGLPFIDGENCFIADTPSNFSNAIVLLVNNENNIQQKFVDNALANISNSIKTNLLVQRRMSLYKEIENNL